MKKLVSRGFENLLSVFLLKKISKSPEIFKILSWNTWSTLRSDSFFQLLVETSTVGKKKNSTSSHWIEKIKHDTSVNKKFPRNSWKLAKYFSLNVCTFFFAFAQCLNKCSSYLLINWLHLSVINICARMARFFFSSCNKSEYFIEKLKSRDRKVTSTAVVSDDAWSKAPSAKKTRNYLITAAVQLCYVRKAKARTE